MDLNLANGITAARAIDTAYRKNAGVFRDTSDLLEYQLPDGVAAGSREHANFLFFLIAQDHGVKSRHLYGRAKALYTERPWLFNPDTIIEMFSGPGPELVEVTGRRLGTRYPNETGRAWYANAQQLTTDYQGDSRRIFTSSEDALAALKRVRRFRGFGPKTSGLLVRTFYGCGFYSLPRLDEVPIPVDIHDTRIAFLVGLLNLPEPVAITSTNYMQFAAKAQSAWMDVCQGAGLDWLILDRALWLLGSRGCSPERYMSCCLLKDCSRETS